MRPPLVLQCGSPHRPHATARRSVDEALAEAVDALVAAGVVASRSEAVRLGLERLVDARRRREVGRRIVEAYRRSPQSEAELAWSQDATRRMIAEEPW